MEEKLIKPRPFGFFGRFGSRGGGLRERPVSEQRTVLQAALGNVCVCVSGPVEDPVRGGEHAAPAAGGGGGSRG